MVFGIFSRKEDSNSMFIETKNIILNVIRKLNDNNKNFKDIKLLPPAWYCLIKSYTLNKKSELDSFDFNNNVNSFLNSINFFQEKKIWVDYILPIMSISSRWDEEKIWWLFMKIINDKIKNKQNLLNWIQKIIWECLNNIIDHSWSEEYNIDWLRCNYSSWQYYYRKEFLQIAIVDNWIWILKSLRKKYPEIQCWKEAIKKALEAKISWWKSLSRDNIQYTQYSNRWIWLTTTLEIIKKIKWDLFIWSRDYIYSYCWKTWKEEFIDIKDNIWWWTFIILNIYSSDLIDLNISEIESKILWVKEKDIFIDFWEN